MNRKLLLASVLLIGFSFALGGCNLFSWTSGEDTESLIDEGIQKMRDGDYQGALAEFTKAMAEDPNSSEARYYHAKATMSASGFNAFNLGVDMAESNHKDGDALPFTGSAWPNDEADRLYTAMATVFTDLKPIYDGKTTGSFSKEDIDLDFAIVTGIRGILFFQDVNLDGLINGGDIDFNITQVDTLGFAFGANDLMNYITNNLGAAKAVGATDAHDDTCAAIAAFNMLLDSIEVVINDSRTVINDILTEETELSPDDIDALLADVILLARNWKINDPADNDGDGNSDKTEEIINLTDDDGDGYIDEDGYWGSCAGY
ncbi:MAG: hypothetical protein P1R58_02275 [bacterium]|nr:hypothetical protein [bacterium]